MNFLQKIYKKSKEQKGFTLVEMIVVLVIIAILAAITIPALLKYIDKARDKQIVIDARTAYLAAETAVSEAYAENISDIAGKTLTFGKQPGGASVPAGIAEVVSNAEDLAGLDTTKYRCLVGVGTDWKIETVSFIESGKVASMNVAAGESWDVKAATPGALN